MRAREFMGEDVWHGSPHRFDKFSLANVGTGEGNNTYGWGLYFTDKREIADWYRDRLTHFRSLKYAVELRGQIYDLQQNDDLFHELLDYIQKHASQAVFIRGATGDQYEDRETKVYYEREIARKMSHSFQMGSSTDPVQWAQKFLADDQPYEEDIAPLNIMLKAAIEFMTGARKPSRREYGATFRVQIPEPDTYLLWDEMDQPPKVAEGLRSLADEMEQEHPDFRQQMGNAMVGQYMYAYLTSLLGSQKAASLKLREHGIMGIKYLDGDSRHGKSESHYNYVLFDDSQIEVQGIV